RGESQPTEQPPVVLQEESGAKAGVFEVPVFLVAASVTAVDLVVVRVADPCFQGTAARVAVPPLAGIVDFVAPGEKLDLQTDFRVVFPEPSTAQRRPGLQRHRL